MSEAKKTVEDLQKQILDLQNKLRAAELKSIGLYNENQQYKMDIAPDAMRMKAELNVQLEIAQTFIDSGAFPGVTPQQAYVIMKAGGEMGLKPIESLNSLYITPKGKIEPYGKALAKFLTIHGYVIDYQEENEKGVHVRVYHPDNGYDFTEIVRVSNPLVSGGYAYKHAPQNKARFHGLRMHLNTRLSHLIGGVSDLFDGTFLEWKEQQAIEQNARLGLAPGQPGLDVQNLVDSKNIDRLKKRIKVATGEQLLNLRETCEKLDLMAEYEERIDILEGIEQEQKQETNEG